MHFSASTFILVPYLNQSSAVEYIVQKRHFLSAILDKFALYLMQILRHNKKIVEGTAPSNGSIWNGLSEQHQHKRTEKSTICNA